MDMYIEIRMYRHGCMNAHIQTCKHTHMHTSITVHCISLHYIASHKITYHYISLQITQTYLHPHRYTFLVSIYIYIYVICIHRPY